MLVYNLNVSGSPSGNTKVHHDWSSWDFTMTQYFQLSYHVDYESSPYAAHCGRYSTTRSSAQLDNVCL